ncbi:MAG: lysophospholipase [Tetragenococcus sp.]|nr:lysophospholipase [Tetragenococcus sp.]
MTEIRMIPSFDGTKLYSIKEMPKHEPKAIVLISHGLAEHASRYDALTNTLLDANYGVYRYDQRGHARSEGARTFFSDFNEMPDDAKVMVDLIKTENPGKPVYLIGHSMGGFTVVAFGTKYPNEAAGIVISGAATRYNLQLFGPLPVEGDPKTYVDNSLSDGVCSDPKVIEAYNNDPLVEKQISIGLMNSLGSGIEWLKENAEAFVDPVLVLHGANDGLVSEKDSRDLYGEIGSADKTLKIYSRLYHEIFNEPVKYEIYQEVIRWLDSQVEA